MEALWRRCGGDVKSVIFRRRPTSSHSKLRGTTANTGICQVLAFLTLFMRFSQKVSLDSALSERTFRASQGVREMSRRKCGWLWQYLQITLIVLGDERAPQHAFHSPSTEPLKSLHSPSPEPLQSDAQFISAQTSCHSKLRGTTANTIFLKAPAF